MDMDMNTNKIAVAVAGVVGVAIMITLFSDVRQFIKDKTENDKAIASATVAIANTLQIANCTADLPNKRIICHLIDRPK